MNGCALGLAVHLLFDGIAQSVGHFGYGKLGAFRKNAFLCVQADGHAFAAHIGCAEFRMCHAHGFFQACHDLQIFGNGFYCIDMLMLLQIGCACNICCVCLFQRFAVGGYFGDLVAYLRVYCKVQGLALVYGVCAFDRCCTYRIYGVIYAVLALYCCLTGQVLGLYHIRSCVCVAPDGYGVVCLTIQLACQFNGVILQELLVVVKINILAAAVACRLFSGCFIRSGNVFGRSLSLFGELAVCLIGCGGLVCLSLVCNGFLRAVISNGFFCSSLYRSLCFFFRLLCFGLFLSVCCRSFHCCFCAGAYTEYLLCGDGCACASLFRSKLNFFLSLFCCRCLCLSFRLSLYFGLFCCGGFCLSSFLCAGGLLCLSVLGSVLALGYVCFGLGCFGFVRSALGFRGLAFRLYNLCLRLLFIVHHGGAAVVFRVLHALCIFDVGGVRIYGDTCSFISAYVCAEGYCHVALVDEQEYHIVGTCVVEYLQICMLCCITAVDIYIELIHLSGLASYQLFIGSLKALLFCFQLQG